MKVSSTSKRLLNDTETKEACQSVKKEEKKKKKKKKKLCILELFNCI